VSRTSSRPASSAVRRWRNSQVSTPAYGGKIDALEPKNLTRLFLTHLHFDHAEGLSFPKIISARSDDAIRTGLAWRRRFRIVGRLVVAARLWLILNGCASRCNGVPRRIYETCLFGSRGDRKIVKSKANACFEQTVSGHLSVKPEPVLRHFFQMFVDENTIMLDPTCGSGSAVRAAEALGAPRILGIELDPEFTDRANIELAKSRRNKSAA
jgi:DNA methylase